MEEKNSALHFRHYLMEPKGQRTLKTFPKGRTCSVEGCETVLSVYNPSGYCSLHAEAFGRASEPRPVRHRETALRRCLYCGKQFLSSSARHKYCCTSCRVRDFQRRAAQSQDKAA